MLNGSHASNVMDLVIYAILNNIPVVEKKTPDGYNHRTTFCEEQQQWIFTEDRQTQSAAVVYTQTFQEKKGMTMLEKGLDMLKE